MVKSLPKAFYCLNRRREGRKTAETRCRLPRLTEERRAGAGTPPDEQLKVHRLAVAGKNCQRPSIALIEGRRTAGRIKGRHRSAPWLTAQSSQAGNGREELPKAFYCFDRG